MLVLHLCKVSCLCRCIVQRLGSADISVLAYNFWQANKASFCFGRSPNAGCQSLVSLRRAATMCDRLQASLLGEAAAPHSAPARTPGVYAQRLCTMQSQQSIHSPSRRGRGLGFRQGCRDRTPKGFAGCKAHKAFL